MWNVVKYDNGVEVEDYGVIQATNIRQLVKKLEEMFKVTGLKYEKDMHTKSPTYYIYHPTNNTIDLVASKWN